MKIPKITGVIAIALGTYKIIAIIITRGSTAIPVRRVKTY
jgi:hypothetical protein